MSDQLRDVKNADMRALLDAMNGENYAMQQRRIAELEAEVERLRSLHEPMLSFVLEAINTAWEGCDYDGFTMEEDLVRFGLLDQRTMTEPCSELCECASVQEFPTECYRMVPALIEARRLTQDGSVD
jgi:hypothetical protein